MHHRSTLVRHFKTTLMVVAVIAVLILPGIVSWARSGVRLGLAAIVLGLGLASLGVLALLAFLRPGPALP